MTTRPLTSYDSGVTGWNTWSEISTTLNFPTTIQPLTCYKQKSNTVEQTGRDQHHSEFSNDHLLAMSERGTEWNVQSDISTILNFPMIIRPLTSYEQQSNRQENINTILNSSMTTRPLTCYELEKNGVA